MFYSVQDSLSKQRYEKLLKIVCSLSKLNSQSNKPYLHYRMAENIFCEAFEADNLSRNDISIDAKKNGIGLGLKTFLHKNGKSLEKIAEFNRDLALFSNKSPQEVCDIVSSLRNDRLDFACRAAGIKEENLFYHCISRDENTLSIHEEKMLKIKTKSIKNVQIKKNSIFFNDDFNEYVFSLSKSTLFKRFSIDTIRSIPVVIIENPYSFLENLLDKVVEKESNPIISSIILPLYSPKLKEVAQRSGLNQWNAKGRLRDLDEIYIPIPAKINQLFPSFFPQREDSFALKLPNGSFLSAKVCQDNNKALMSNPNRALGEWLLRDVLNISKGTLVTYATLQNAGIDSVQINKFQDNTYEITFKQLGSYGEFMENFE